MQAKPEPSLRPTQQESCVYIGKESLPTAVA
jgi:hypothetical protein